MDDMQTHGKYITWPILTLMAFVTVIGFDDIMYNFQNQGMTVITSWILMLFLYVIPYSLMVGHLGSVFNQEGGGPPGPTGPLQFPMLSIPLTPLSLVLVGPLPVQINSKTRCQMPVLLSGHSLLSSSSFSFSII